MGLDGRYGPTGSMPAPIRRTRVPGRPTQKAFDRIGPRRTQSPTAQRIIRLVGTLGPVPLELLARLVSDLQDRSLTATYIAVQALCRTHVLETLSVTDVGIQRAPGLGRFVVPGVTWATRAHALGLEEYPPLVTGSDPDELVAAVVWNSEVMRRLALGWRVATGTDWIRGVARLPVDGQYFDRARRMLALEQSGGLEIPAGIEVAGMLPPRLTRDTLPMLWVRGGSARAEGFKALLRAVEAVAPFEVVVRTRSAKARDWYRRAIGQRLAREKFSPLTVLPIRRGTPWVAHWVRVRHAFTDTDRSVRVASLRTHFG